MNSIVCHEKRRAPSASPSCREVSHDTLYGFFCVSAVMASSFVIISTVRG